MFTISYKHFYIHGYIDSNAVRVQAADWSIINKSFTSLRAAKRFIRSQNKKG